jgi:hypothetical protein
MSEFVTGCVGLPTVLAGERPEHAKKKRCGFEGERAASRP